MTMPSNIYRVTCRGMHSNAVGYANGVVYVLADDPTTAYEKVKERLDQRNLGVARDRELAKVELIATANDLNYPDLFFF